MKNIAVRETMSRVIPHDRVPIAIEPTFELNNKPEYLVPFELKPDTSSIFVVKQTPELDGLHNAEYSICPTSRQS